MQGAGRRVCALIARQRLQIQGATPTACTAFGADRVSDANSHPSTSCRSPCVSAAPYAAQAVLLPAASLTQLWQLRPRRWLDAAHVGLAKRYRSSSSSSSGGGGGGSTSTPSDLGTNADAGTPLEDAVAAVPIDGGSSSSSSGPGGDTSQTLNASLDRLVHSAVELVEQGKLSQAVEVYRQGISLLEAAFPDTPELGELHNQTGLLLFFQGKADEAAEHAQRCLDSTRRHFGQGSVLTAARMLRLGAVRFGQGRLEDAQELLTSAAEQLRATAPDPRDPAIAEADFFRLLVHLSGATEPGQVKEVEEILLATMQQLVDQLGGQSLSVSLAMGQHSRVVNLALDGDVQLAEALFRQHIKLQELQDPNSPEIGLTSYQLATYYYAHDLLHDAGSLINRAATVLRRHYPEEHDLLLLCRHRLGMVAAAQRDARSATALLGATRQHYKQQDANHPLASEAEFGLALCRLRGLDPRLPTAERQQARDELLAEMRSCLEAMAAALGSDHMLVQGASRYFAQASMFSQ